MRKSSRRRSASWSIPNLAKVFPNFVYNDSHGAAFAISTVSLPHKDPFDHILLTQATVEGLSLVTSDRALLNLGRADVLDARL